MLKIKNLIKKTINKLGYNISKTNAKQYNNLLPQDLDEDFVSIFQSNPNIGHFTEKLYTTYKATEYIVKNNIRGDLVECGVLEGRQIVIMALTLVKLGETSRKIYLYDTFEGMTEPGIYDFKKARNISSKDNHNKWLKLKRDNFNLYCYSPIDQVKKNVYSSGYPEENFIFVKGDIKKTAPNNFHEKIAFLRLDTDWYELTKHELECFYELLVKKGVLVIDDYGSWYGSRKAVDDYFSEKDLNPLLIRTQRSERLILKQE